MTQRGERSLNESRQHHASHGTAEQTGAEPATPWPGSGIAAAVLQSVEASIIVVDESGRVVLLNPAAERLFGWAEAELRDWPLHPLIDAAEVDEGLTPGSWHALRRVLRQGGQAEVAAARFTRRDGTIVPVSLSITALDPRAGRGCAVVTAQDISERLAQAAALEYRALHDPLTGLPNRALFQDRLQQALLAGRRSGQPVGVLLFDLDGFKQVNDSLGHAAGDALLRQIGERVRAALRASDTVARLGGDEFAIVLPGAGEGGGGRVGQQVRRALMQPFTIEGRGASVGVSIGIAVAPEHGGDVDTLLRHADAAMYEAKRSRGGVAVFRDRREA